MVAGTCSLQTLASPPRSACRGTLDVVVPFTCHQVCLCETRLSLSKPSLTPFTTTECQGGIISQLEAYSTQSNDIWSLGVILVNLTCGRNPWRQACPADETFRAFLENPNFLRSILPISKGLNYILRRIFDVDPRYRLTLKQLRSLVADLDTFNMTESELQHAHSAAQAAAASVAKTPRAHVRAARAVIETNSSSGSSSYATSSDEDVFVTRRGTFQQTPQLEASSPSLGTYNRSQSSSADGSSLPPTPPTLSSDAAAGMIPTHLSFNLDQGNYKEGLGINPNGPLCIMRPMSIEVNPRHANPFVI